MQARKLVRVALLVAALATVEAKPPINAAKADDLSVADSYMYGNPGLTPGSQLKEATAAATAAATADAAAATADAAAATADAIGFDADPGGYEPAYGDPEWAAANSVECPTRCKEMWRGDGECDLNCNTRGCNWDDGDCFHGHRCRC